MPCACVKKDVSLQKMRTKLFVIHLLHLPKTEFQKSWNCDNLAWAAADWKDESILCKKNFKKSLITISHLNIIKILNVTSSVHAMVVKIQKSLCQKNVIVCCMCEKHFQTKKVKAFSDVQKKRQWSRQEEYGQKCLFSLMSYFFHVRQSCTPLVRPPPTLRLLIAFVLLLPYDQF